MGWGRLIRRLFTPWRDLDRERESADAAVHSEEIRLQAIAARIKAEKVRADLRADYRAMARRLER